MNESKTPETDKLEYGHGWQQLMTHARSLEIRLAEAMRELEVARTPICVGQPIIQILAEKGQWFSENGNGVIAADSLFQKDPYQELTTLRNRELSLMEALIQIKNYEEQRDGICPYGCDTPNIAKQALSLNPTALAEIEMLRRKAKALDAAESLTNKTPIAIWQGSFIDSEQNIHLGRVGAPIFTVSTMNDDGNESNEDNIGEGQSFLEAIESAIAKEK